MSDSERTKTAEYVPYVAPADTDKQIIQLLIKYFHFRTLTEYTELTFLILGIIYFLEAIVKNTLEMIR